MTEVRKSEWAGLHDGWKEGGTAVMTRLVGLALRRALGRPDTHRLHSIEYLAQAQTDVVPEDWHALLEFVELGGRCRARVRRPQRAG